MTTRFEDLLRDFNVPIAPNGHEHTRPGWLQFDCPFCSKGWLHYRMGYNLAHRYCNCWACGGHSLANVLVAWGDVSYQQAKKLLEGVVVEKVEVIDKRGRLELPKGIVDEFPIPHQRYLRQRGFKWKELVRLWGLKGITISTKGMSWRIFVPIIHHGKVVSWTTRSIKSTGRRWRSAAAEQEIVNHKTLLYGEDYCRHACIVHEGPSDVWATGPGAVGTCGIGFSRAQVERLAKYPVRAICFDTSPDAQKRALQLCDLLEPFQGATMNVVLETGDDPADVLINGDPDELADLRRHVLGHP